MALLLLAALLFAGLLALGVWQLQRLAWKQDLIARVEERLGAEPVGAPSPLSDGKTWPSMNRAEHEYRRLRVQGRFDHTREVQVWASTALGSGYWVLTPLWVVEQQAAGAGFWLLVNRGFVPPEQRDPAGRAQPQGPQQITGLLRLSEPGGSLLRRNDASAGRWYSRDVAAVAAAQGLKGPVAPYFIDAGADDPATAVAWPRPGLTVLQFSNNHLVYALTWFALAAMVGGAAVLLWRHHAAGEPTLVPHRD